MVTNRRKIKTRVDVAERRERDPFGRFIGKAELLRRSLLETAGTAVTVNAEE